MAGKWSDEQKAHALEIYRTDGPNEAERQTGIPHSSIIRWAQAQGVELESIENKSKAVQAARLVWQKRRNDLVEEMSDTITIAHLGVQYELIEAHWKEAKDAATTMAILIDKAQLLSGGATGRTETSHMTREEIERKIKELRNDELAQRRAEKSA